MTGRVRIAVLSFWHVHAKDYARAAAKHPAVDLVAAWDEDAERGRARAGEFGIDLAPSLPALLSRDDVDAVVVTTPTAAHRDVLIAAANAGKHIFTEKVLAPTVHECADVVAAVNQAGVALVVATGHPVEDTAVAVLRHAGGALGVVEAGFVTPYSPFAVEAHGTEGSLLYGLPEPRLLLRAGPEADGEWTEVPLPAPEPSPFERFVAHVRDGTRDQGNAAMAVDLTRLMAAAYESARTGTTIALTEGTTLA